MAQQTAVDHIIEQLLESGHLTIEATYYCKNLIRRAKNIEKEQIINAYVNKGFYGDYDYVILLKKQAEQYYNETYNK